MGKGFSGNYPKNRASNVLSFTAFLGTLLAVIGLLLPMILFMSTHTFDGKALFTMFFLAIAIERFWFSLFTSKEKNPLKVSRDWTFVAVGLAYTFMMYGTIIEFYFHRTTIQSVFIISGLLLFFNSLMIRYWAVKTLGNQWAIHVDSGDKTRRFLIKSGPYQYVRHPIYLAATLEVIGIPLFFGAFYTLIFSILVCIPFQIIRTYYEERNSIEIFGDEYRQYKKSTWAFLPIKKGETKLRF